MAAAAPAPAVVPGLPVTAVAPATASSPPAPAAPADPGQAIADALDDVVPDPVVPADVVPTAPVLTGGNTNISIRIFSPGDDGPVIQVGGRGGGGGGAAAPLTWIWNWTWSGAPTCPAPDAGVPGWTWNWTCGPAAAPGSAPATPADMIDSLDEILSAALPAPLSVPVPGAVAPAAAVAPDVAQPPERLPSGAARAGGGRPGQRVHAAADAGAVAPATWAPPSAAPAPAALVPPAVSTPPERAAARNRRGDTTREHRAISPVGGSGAMSIAAAGGVAAAGAGSGPAVLATLISCSHASSCARCSRPWACHGRCCAARGSNGLADAGDGSQRSAGRTSGARIRQRRQEKA